MTPLQIKKKVAFSWRFQLKLMKTFEKRLLFRNDYQCSQLNKVNIKLAMLMNKLVNFCFQKK